MKMAKIKINYPNDYESDSDYKDAVADCGEDEESILDKLAEVASISGLEFVESKDFGAIWEGSEEEIENCKKNLPAWAKNYTSTIDGE
jgi:hypothetical protein